MYIKHKDNFPFILLCGVYPEAEISCIIHTYCTKYNMGVSKTSDFHKILCRFNQCLHYMDSDR